MIKWLRKLFRRKPRNAQISVNVGEQLFLVFKRLADRDGLTVNNWAKRTLTLAVPNKELRQINRHALLAAGLDAVYEQLDRDELEMPNFLPLASPAVRALSTPPAVPGHPCVFLRAEFPSGMTGKDCQGSCGAAKQEGRACHWTAAVAAQCDVYEPRFKLPIVISR